MTDSTDFGFANQLLFGHAVERVIDLAERPELPPANLPKTTGVQEAAYAREALPMASS